MESKLDQFQLEEYKNISTAHFETNKQIGEFFRYFLLIASAPAIIFAWFGKDGQILNEILSGNFYNKNVFIGLFLIFISLTGTLACFYLISLRLDSILYARTVNGIRKYFYSHENSFEDHYRVLPKQINVPKYKQRHTFTIIVYSFAIINSIYFAIGTFIISIVGVKFFHSFFPTPITIIINNYNLTWILIFASILFLIHIGYYSFISNYRTYSYLKNLTIGIDIDGVLNKHREDFCTNLYEKTHKILTPEEIIKIPVHLIPNILRDKGIDRNDEFLVFNDPKYWINQKSIDPKIGLIIKELKDVFGYKIHIFSYRAWPDISYLNQNKYHHLKLWWYFEFPNLRLSIIPFGSWFFSKRFIIKRRFRIIKRRKINLPIINVIFFQRFINTNLYSRNLKFFTIRRITRKWLNRRNIPYNKLTIEKNSIDVKSLKLGLFRIPKSFLQNRFYFAHKFSYRYFVEDDPKNAIKLCASCEYVFLIDHPYNQIESTERIPSNLLRVKNWSEIKEKIRELG